MRFLDKHLSPLSGLEAWGVLHQGALKDLRRLEGPPLPNQALFPRGSSNMCHPDKASSFPEPVFPAQFICVGPCMLPPV